MDSGKIWNSGDGCRRRVVEHVAAVVVGVDTVVVVEVDFEGRTGYSQVEEHVKRRERQAHAAPRT